MFLYLPLPSGCFIILSLDIQLLTDVTCVLFCVLSEMGTDSYHHHVC